MRHALGVVALALAATLASSASGASGAAARGVEVQRLERGPVLVGEDVVWVERRGEEGAAVMRSRRAREAPVELARLGPPAGPPLSVTFEAGGVHLAGSVDGYAIAYRAYHRGGHGSGGGPHLDEVLFGRPGEAPATIARCDRYSKPFGDPVVSLAPGVFGFTRDSCTRELVEVRRPADRVGDRTVEVPAQALAVAGSFAATDSGARGVEIHDLATGRSSAITVAPGIHATSVALREDGRVVFAAGPDRDLARLWTAEPARPQAVALPVREGVGYQPRIAGDDVVFRRQRGERAEIGHLDLSTGRGRVLVPGLPPNLRFNEGVDFDGRRVAWAAPACTGSAIRFMDGLAPQPVPREVCPLRLAGRPRVRGSLVTVRYRCSGYAPAGRCPGTVEIATASRPRRRLGGSRSMGRTGRARKATIRLGARGRCLLRGRARLRVRVTARTRDYLGRVERRSTEAVLRRDPAGRATAAAGCRPRRR